MTRSTDDLLTDLLAECADLIMAGAPVEACLARHAEHAAALEPLLSTLVQVRQLCPVPARPVEVVARSRAQFMAAAQQVSAPARGPRALTWREQLAAWWLGLRANLSWPSPRMPAGLLAALLMVILGGLLITGVLAASAKALPGDFLYPVKLGGEDISLLLSRDPVARDQLRQEFAVRRVEEAKAVIELGRPVPDMALAGTIETIHGDTWTVSGLVIHLTADTRIEGQPEVGSRIQGRMRAPGDGTLVALSIRAEQPPSGGPTPPAALMAPAAAAPTGLPLPATPTATASAPAGDDHAGIGWPTQAVAEPTERPEHQPTPSATTGPPQTPRPSLTPTATASSTGTPAPTVTEPRPEVKVRIEGWVKSIDGNRWTVDDTTFRTDGGTQYIGQPGVGWRVSALLRVDPDGYTALQIAALSGPEATPEPLEFTGVVQAINGAWWTIGSYQVKTTGETQFEGDPKAGDLVSVKAQRRAGGEIWALKISAIREVEVQFQGRIDAINADSLVIDGHLVYLDSQTTVIGQPEVGLDAQVSARQMPDGRLIARVVKVLAPEPTPTPTPTATPEPTATATPEPTPTATLAPTEAATSEPTPTATAEPAATETQVPAETAAPEPASTPELTPWETTTPSRWDW